MAVDQFVASQVHSNSTCPKPSKKQKQRAEGAERVNMYAPENVIARIQFSPSVGNATEVDKSEGLENSIEGLVHIITQGGH